MKRSLSNTRTAVYKRNKRKLRKFITAFPADEGLSIPKNYFISHNDGLVANVNPVSTCENFDRESDDIADIAVDSGTGAVFNPINENELDRDACNDHDQNELSNDIHDDDNHNGSDHFSSYSTDDDCSTSDDSSWDTDGDDDDNSSRSNVDNDISRHNSFLSINMPDLEIPLIAQRTITVKDHLLAAVATSVRHRLTFEATLDQLKWIKSTYYNNTIPTNKEKFWHCLNRNNDCFTYHYYCKICEDYIGKKCKSTKKLQKQCICEACGPHDEDECHLGYFIYISLAMQIKELFSIPNISELLKYRFRRIKKDENAYEDLYDGEEYKSLCLPGNFLDKWNNFSLTFNTDGCNVANSSNSSAWPIYIQINELPPHVRKKHMLLAAIYVDQVHPVMNNFLRPLTDEMEELFHTGITWKPSNTSQVTSKFIMTIGSLDAPARAAVVCHTQYNGYFGCLYCYAKGRSLGRGKFVYPLSQCYQKLRTDAELRGDMASAFDTGKVKCGVKNVSSLVALPLFNINKGIIVESMHAVYLGVDRQHTRLLLTKAKAPYYVGSPKSLKLIDECLLSITPPSCRSRKPRSISTYLKWKASEWRNWLEYAPICLQNVLPKKYIDHLALLSEAIYYLNSDCITSTNLDRCEILLKEYVELFEEYFGEEKMTSNIHLLTHLVTVVRNWGPLWAHNAFDFEAWNRRIMEFVTSSYARTNQVAERFLMHKFIINTLYDESISFRTKKFIAKQIKMPLDKDGIERRNRLIGYGKCRSCSPTVDERALLNEKGFDPANLKCFQKMKLNGKKYTCEKNKKLKVFDSTVHDGNDTFGIIVNMVQFQNNEESISGMFIKRMQLVGHVFNTTYINQVRLTNSVCFIQESSLMKPAVQISSSGNLYVIKQNNCWETD